MINRFFHRFRSDTAFRRQATLFSGCSVNFAYTIFLMISGWLIRSLWIATMAFYYLSLTAMRSGMIWSLRKDPEEKQWRRYRSCGMVLLVLTVIQFGISILTLTKYHTITYPFYLIYGVAAYTFCRVITTIRIAIITRKNIHPIYSANNTINMASSAISLYLLQSALLSAFGGGDEKFAFRMGVLLGAAITAYIVYLSVSLMRRGKRLMLEF